jgi:hypothetical protein
MPFSAVFSSICFGNGKFVAVASNSQQCATSPDGITWTTQTMLNSRDWTGVAAGPGVFVAVAQGFVDVSASSPDGITWTEQAMPSGGNWKAITSGAGSFVAIATNGVSAVSP